MSWKPGLCQSWWFVRLLSLYLSFQLVKLSLPSLLWSPHWLNYYCLCCTECPTDRIITHEQTINVVPCCEISLVTNLRSILGEKLFSWTSGQSVSADCSCELIVAGVMRFPHINTRFNVMVCPSFNLIASICIMSREAFSQCHFLVSSYEWKLFLPKMHYHLC